jgi:4,5-dihydroxyphthalate decarboxylase
MRLAITVACWDYDRTRALFDGRVAIEGCDANLLALPIEETFFRALRSAEFDVAELSLSSYMVLRARGASPYVAIPVFLSRAFRHSCIYIRTDKDIVVPGDLTGRTVGVPEYQLTALVWARGILEDDYGLKPSALRWRTGGLEQPGRHEKIELARSAGLDIAPIPADETLSQWLLDGRVDAVLTPRAPRCFIEGADHVGRLFPDFRRAEREYFARTRIFPIMHVVGIRATLLERHPWLAASVFKAFLAAKRVAEADLAEVAALKVTLPWLAAEYAETVALMGRDFWSYGVAGNEAALETFARYHAAQGLSPRPLTLGELFAPSTLDQVRL